MQHSTPTRLTYIEQIWHKWLRRPYRLHVTDHGGSGPTIVFLHGLASSNANWQYIVPLLRGHYRCIMIELVGFGQSPKPQWYNYDMDDHLRCIEAAIGRLRIRQPFTLVGHSLGGLIATRYAREHPRRVGRLVLLSPPVYAPLHTIASRAARQRTSMYLRAYRFLRGHKRFTPENIRRLSQIIPQVRSLVMGREYWVPFVRSLERSIEQQSLVDDIRHVPAPVDIFYGVFDEVIVPYNVRQLAKIRAVSLHPLRVGHMVGKRYSAAVVRVLSP